MAAATGVAWYRWLARGGLVAKGVSFGIVGVLAILLALGQGGRATSREGALQSIASDSGGTLLLALLAVGFAAYAGWRFVQAYQERGGERGASQEATSWAKRAGYVGRGLIYAGLALGTIKLIIGSGDQESQTQRAHKTTAVVLDWPAGRWIAGGVGLGIVGAGVWNLYRGITRKFEERWRMGEMSEIERKWGGRAGLLGHVARAVVFGLVGIFVTKAALEFDPQEAIGLDGALQKLARTGYGPYLLGLTATGLLCYGLYCLVDARYRDVSA
jgi:hypothetical protein